MNKLAALALVSLATSLVACADPHSGDESLASVDTDLTVAGTPDVSVKASLSRPVPTRNGTVVTHTTCERTYACRSALGLTRWVLVESKSCKFHGYDRYFPVESMDWLDGEVATIDGDSARFTVRVADGSSDDASYDCAEATE